MLLSVGQGVEAISFWGLLATGVLTLVTSQGLGWSMTVEEAAPS
jgi:hypothetical protein